MNRRNLRILLLWGMVHLSGIANMAWGDTVAARYYAGVEGNPAVTSSPEAEGWTRKDPSSDQGNFVNAGVEPDGSSGLNAWRTLDNSSASGQHISWTHSVSATDRSAGSTQGWTLAARLRVADPVAGNAGSRSVMVYYGDGARRWILFFDIHPSGHLVATFDSSSPGIELNDLDATEYHEHQLIYDPETATADYWVDGVLRHSGYTGQANASTGVAFGTGSSGGRGDGYWNEVALSIHDAVLPGGPAPMVTQDPESVAAPLGTEVVLTAEFDGETTGIQWFKDGMPLTGATNAWWILNPLSVADGGEYWCRASNGPDHHSCTRTAVVAPLVPGAGLRITEILASNKTGLRDEDGERSDWIEIFNGDTVPISTAGWRLSDKPGQAGGWELPPDTLGPGEFRIIFASGKNRSAPNQIGHADFSLSAGGERVVLLRPDSSIASEVGFGPQASDISYGTTWHPSNEWRYFEPPTPGHLQMDGRWNITAGIQFDPPPGVFAESTNVTVTAPHAGAGSTLHYTTDGSRPDTCSPELTGPLPLTQNTQLRVALIYPGERYGICVSAHYLKRGADVASFSSPLPLVVMSNFGAGDIPGVSSRGPHGDGSGVVQEEPQAQALMTWEDSTGGATVLEGAASASTRAALRRRGSSSFNFSRRSYRLYTRGDLDKENGNLSLLGMPAEHDWVLYAPDPSQFDITLLHNAFLYELARRSGFPAPRFRLVELFLDTNGDGQVSMSDHCGLYMLVETVKRDSARVDFPYLSEDGTQGGWMINVDRMDSLPPGSTPGSLQPRQFHTAGPDRILQTPDDVARGAQTSDDQPNYYHSFFNFDSPQGWSILPEQRTTIQNVMRAFDSALYGPDYKDLTLGWAPHIDAVNWSHHLALHQLSRNQDAIVLSSYLMREGPTAPLRWASVWDFDRAFAAMGSATANLTWAHDRMYYPRLLSDPEFAQIHVDTWQTLRRGAFATAEMHVLIDELAAEITPAVAARSGIHASTWQTNVASMKTWLAARAAAIDALNPATPVFSSTGGPITPGLHLTLSAPSGTIYYTTDGSDPRARGGSPSANASAYGLPLPIVGPVTVTARALVSGKWSGPVSAVFFSPASGPRFLPGGNASWNIAANWESNQVPDGAGAAATIGQPDAGDRAVSLTSPVTLGILWFDHAGSTFRNRLNGTTGSGLAFDSNSADPAVLHITGNGLGFVEFDLADPVVLTSDLILQVDNVVGDPEHGALRLRRTWSGSGGLQKAGSGVVSLTGSGKNYLGPTLVDNGVLQVTASAAPSNSAVSVKEGGQLRLISSGVPEYAFSMHLILAGNGRGADIPDGDEYGKLGALRYDPGTTGNDARLIPPVMLAGDAHIHVASMGNRLRLEGGLAGTGLLTKSGEGTLRLDQGSGIPLPTQVQAGVLELAGTGTGSMAVGSGAELALLPGKEVGTGPLNLAEGAQLRMSPGTNGVHTLEVHGDTVLSHARLRVEAAPESGNIWILLHCTGTITGRFDMAESVLPEGWGVEYDESGGKVSLVRQGMKTFGAWIGEFNTNGQNRFEDDPDGDGLPNGIEYTLYNGDPLQPYVTSPMHLLLENGVLRLELLRAIHSRSGALLEVELSVDLAHWPVERRVSIGESTVDSSSGVEIFPEAEFDRVRVTLPAEEPRLYLRLRAVER